MLLVVLFLGFCFVIIGLMGLIFEKDPATPKKTRTSNTLLKGDYVKKLCHRVEEYKVIQIKSDKIGLLPWRIGKRMPRPPCRGPLDSSDLVWITMDEFNKHFEIL